MFSLLPSVEIPGRRTSSFIASGKKRRGTTFGDRSRQSNGHSSARSNIFRGLEDLHRKLPTPTLEYDVARAYLNGGGTPRERNIVNHPVEFLLFNACTGSIDVKVI